MLDESALRNKVRAALDEYFLAGEKGLKEAVEIFQFEVRVCDDCARHSQSQIGVCAACCIPVGEARCQFRTEKCQFKELRNVSLELRNHGAKGGSLGLSDDQQHRELRGGRV